MKRAIDPIKRRLVADTAPINVSVCAQSRDRLLRRPEGTVGGAQARPTRGTESVGGTGRGIRKRVKEVNIRKLGRD